MPFITQGKTNWKFLLVIIVLAVIVGGGALRYAKRPEKAYQTVEIKKQEKVFSEFIQINQPKINQTISGFFQIEGTVNFPQEIMDNNVFIEMKDDNGHSLIPSFGTQEQTSFTISKNETPFSMNISYRYPSSAKGMITVFIYVPTEGFVPTEEIPASWSRKVLAEIPIIFGEEIFNPPSDWKTYNNPEANFTFRYPSDWEIDTDYLYETAGGVKADERTVVVVKGEKYGITINMGQYPCPTQEVSKGGHTNYIGTCSEDPQSLDIFGKILSTFRVTDETADWNTYMDRKYKYEVKYPDYWIYLGGLGASIGSFNVKAPVESNNPSDRIESRIFPRKGSESNQEYIDNIIRESVMPGYMDLLSKKEVTFNNIKGYELIWKITDYKTNKTYKGPIDVFFETPSGNKARFIVLVFAGEASEDNPNLSIFRRVLTTFNFLGTEETSCENWTKECAGEGEDLCSVCGCKNCCSGLVKREIKYPYSDENNEVSCLEEMTAYTCVKCGDKICSRGEDWCICSEDCKKPKAWEASFKEMALSMVPKAIVCCNAAGNPAIQTVVGAAVCNPTIGKNWPTASAVGTITVNTNCQPDGSFSMTITPGTSNSGTCINAICTQETCTFNGC